MATVVNGVFVLTAADKRALDMKVVERSNSKTGEFIVLSFADLGKRYGYKRANVIWQQVALNGYYAHKHHYFAG